MSESYIFCIDSETGDLDPKKGDILTLYMAVTDDNLTVLDGLDLKLKPNDRLPVANAEALKVNKIDLKKHLEDPATITYAEAKVKITEFAKKYLKKRGRYSNLYILGQNVGFDLDFIWEYIMSKTEWEAIFSYDVEDTKKAAKLLKRAGWLPADIGTLTSLVEFFGIPKREAHEAKGDVLMTIDVYKAILAMLESRKSGGQVQDIISLLEAE